MGRKIIAVLWVLLMSPALLAQPDNEKVAKRDSIKRVYEISDSLAGVRTLENVQAKLDNPITDLKEIKEIQGFGEQIEELNRELEEAKFKTISIGFSIGPRFTNEAIYDYAITADTTLTRDRLGGQSLLLSSSLNILPFTKNEFVLKRIKYFEDRHRNWKRFGWALIKSAGVFVNINLADFSTQKSELSFNKTIDGGIGLGLRVAPRIYLAGGWEWFTIRQLRGYYADKIGTQLQFGGETLTQLDTENNDLFRNQTFTGWSIRFIIAL